MRGPGPEWLDLDKHKLMETLDTEPMSYEP